MIAIDKITTIFFGGEDYWYHNRGHVDIQLIRRMAKLGPALYVNSIVMQKPRLFSDKRFFMKLKRKAKSIFTGLKESGEGFWVYSPFSLPLHHARWGRKINKAVLNWQIKRVSKKLGLDNPVVWIACPAACEVATGMSKSKLVYLRTDRHEEFPNVDADAISRYDRTLKAQADLTIFVNQKLHEQEMNQCNRTLYLDHGVDFELFAGAADDTTMPEEMQNVPRPIVGFFGGIDGHTFDLDFVERVVDLVPEASFVFVGKSSLDCSALAARHNVVMVGQKPYEEIPHYGKCFDAAIMPWRQNRWIEACNPIKLKEYMALGKPIVSTPFPELETYRDYVYEAKEPNDFAQCITKALKQDGVEKIIARQRKVENSSWDSKAQLVLDKLFNGDSR